MIYKIRIILDAEEDIFRDIEINDSSSLEDLHNAVTQSFGFLGNEMASFYTCDEAWNQDEEIALFDISEDAGTSRLMNETFLEDILSEQNPKLLYVYDFMSMWTFYVELAEIVDETEGLDYPNLMFVQGQVPENAPDKVFEADSDDEDYNEFEDGLDVDDYEDLDFNENWN